jgi:hypothetical protein
MLQARVTLTRPHDHLALGLVVVVELDVGGWFVMTRQEARRGGLVVEVVVDSTHTGKSSVKHTAHRWLLVMRDRAR